MNTTSPFPNRIKGVFFDLDGTIRENEPSVIEMIISAVKERGGILSPEIIRRMVRGGHAFWSDRERVQSLRLTVEDEQVFWERYFLTYLQFSDIPEQQQEIISKECGSLFYNTMHLTDGLMKDAVLTLKQLRERGYIIGLVSNRSRGLSEPLLELDLEPYFDFTLSAGEANSWKPDMQIFYMALEKSGNLHAEETVFVGDNYYTDIMGAERVGMHTVLLDVHDAFQEIASCLRIHQLRDLLNYL